MNNSNYKYTIILVNLSFDNIVGNNDIVTTLLQIV